MTLCVDETMCILVFHELCVGIMTTGVKKSIECFIIQSQVFLRVAHSTNHIVFSPSLVSYRYHFIMLFCFYYFFYQIIIFHHVISLLYHVELITVLTQSIGHYNETYLHDVRLYSEGIYLDSYIGYN